MQARDIADKEEWAAAYAMEVPVLAAEIDGQEVSEGKSRWKSEGGTSLVNC
jgi:hypothetical protein